MAKLGKIFKNKESGKRTGFLPGIDGIHTSDENSKNSMNFSKLKNIVDKNCDEIMLMADKAKILAHQNSVDINERQAGNMQRTQTFRDRDEILESGNPALIRNVSRSLDISKTGFIK